MMKHIYIASCVENGGIYHYTFENGKLSLKEKTALDRPMYMIKRDNKMYVVLRETDTENHFGGLVTFQIDDNGKLINPSDTISTKGIVPCHLEVNDEGIYEEKRMGKNCNGG